MNQAFQSLNELESKIDMCGGLINFCDTYGISDRTVRRYKQELRDKLGGETTIIIGDTHFPYSIPNCYSFLKTIKNKYKAKKLIHMGDLVDLHTASRHQQLPDLMGASDELENAQDKISALVDLFPSATLVLGNHDDRIYRMTTKVGVASHFVKTTREVYGLPDEWKIVKHDEINTPYGVAQIRHGHDFSGSSAAERWYNKLHTSVIIGHVHTSPSIRFYRTAGGQKFSAICPCLADENSIAMEYAKAFGGCFVNGCMVMTPDLISYEFI